GALRAAGTKRPVLGFGPAPGGGIQILVAPNVPDAALHALFAEPTPASIEGFAIFVVREALSVTSATPGTIVKHAYGAETGTLTCVLLAGGRNWAISGSHVLAPPEVSPWIGDDIWIGSGPAATLGGWSPLAAFTIVSTDVAIAQTTLAI